MSSLGHWDIPGDPGAVLTVADRMITIAADTAEIGRRVKADVLAGTWSGPAADAFQDLVEELPRDIEKISRAHDAAGSALSSFGHELQQLKAQAAKLAGQLDSARSQAAASAERERLAAQRSRSAEMEYMQGALHDPAAQRQAAQRLTLARSDLAGARSANVAAQTTVSSVEASAKRLHERFEDAARAAAKAVDEACTLSRGDRVGAWYARYVDGTIVDVALDAIVAPFRAIAQLPDAINDFLKDPSWTRAREVLEGLGAVLTIAAVVVAVAAAFVTLPISAATLIGLGVLVAGVKLGVTYAAVKSEGLDPKELVGDTIGLGLSAVPAAKLGGKIATAGSKSARTHFIKYGLSYNPLPISKALSKAGSDRVEDAIASVLVDVEYATAGFLLGGTGASFTQWLIGDGFEPVPTTWTPAQDPGIPQPLQNCNATVRHAIALDVPAVRAA